MSATARLDLRLDAQDKDKIAHAADLRGVPVATFVRDAALQEAGQVVASALTVTLSRSESRHFLDVMDAPFKPNAKLKRAMAAAARLAR
jgi:uncharacterized protein (DUF1778 family)